MWLFLIEKQEIINTDTGARIYLWNMTKDDFEFEDYDGAIQFEITHGGGDADYAFSLHTLFEGTIEECEYNLARLADEKLDARPILSQYGTPKEQSKKDDDKGDLIF